MTRHSRASWQEWLDDPKADPRWEVRRRLREGFFAAIEQLAPQVLRNLAGDPFDRFRDYTLRVVRGDITPTEPARPLLWRDISCPGPADHPAVGALRSSLREWSRSCHLEAEWCLDWALVTLAAWDRQGQAMGGPPSSLPRRWAGEPWTSWIQAG